VLARDYSTPPPMVGDLTVADFGGLIDAIDAQATADRHHAVRDGR
jgi:hypothetical protein